MRSYRVLFLTDHTKHSSENSLYAIVRQLSTDKRCTNIDVASRGLAENDLFFNADNLNQLTAVSADKQFEFDPSGKSLSRETRAINPDDYDIIFMRLPRPVTDNFLRQLKIRFPTTLFINDPIGIINTSNKAFLLEFQDICPPITLCKSIEDVISLSEQYAIVMKPLREYGGKGIFKISNNLVSVDSTEYEVRDFLKTVEKELTSEGYLAMKYLKNVTQGDKRLIVVNGEILAASLRLPPKGSWLCNVALGGKSVASTPTNHEQDIVQRINPLLKQHGILIYGVDTLVDDEGQRTLSEINTLSIGGFPQAELQTGKPIIQMTIDKLFDYADQQ